MGDGAWLRSLCLAYRRMERVFGLRGSFSLEANLLGTILLLVLILLVLGAVPTWPHSRQWGYAPSGTLGTVLVIVLILVLMGRI